MKAFFFLVFAVLMRLIMWAWTTPKTWTSEPLTSSDMNTYIRDNQNNIKSRLDNVEIVDVNEAADYTTTSSSFVEVDGGGTELDVTITTTSGQVLFWFIGTIQHTSGTALTYFDVAVDGVRQSADDGRCAVRVTASNVPFTVAIPIVITGLSNGSHTFTLMWKTSTSTATLYAGAGTSNFDLHAQIGVMEL